jgi:hypothetical protein
MTTRLASIDEPLAANVAIAPFLYLKINDVESSQPLYCYVFSYLNIVTIF